MITQPPTRRRPWAEREAKGKPRKAQGKRVAFPPVEPWAEPVNGADLLNWLSETFSRYVALPAGAAEAMALWTVHAHAHDCFSISPLLVLKSPTPRCGKTTALLVLGRLVPKPLHAGSVTGPVLFRAIDKYKPTMLLDEADAYMGDAEELRGLLNNGHNRENATVLRTVGEGHEVRAFSVWTPKAIASIGALAATLQDRSVTVEMRRKRKDETVARLRIDRHEVEDLLRRKIARWVADHAQALREADPEVPEGLDDTEPPTIGGRFLPSRTKQGANGPRGRVWPLSPCLRAGPTRRASRSSS